MTAFFEKLDAVAARYDALSEEMGRPEVAVNPSKLQQLAREQRDLEAVVHAYRTLQDVERGIGDTQQMLEDGLDLELRELAQEELRQLRARRDLLEQEIKILLLPRDPNDERNVIVEIRQGEGGDEAGLFAADLYRMYARYAEGHNWKFEVLNSNENSTGGFKEVVFQINGEGAYSRLKYEGGVHRVQRVPATEARGRIHTSTATVAVLPETTQTDVEVRDADLRIDVYRSGGHGGQGVNTTDSAVRLTHLPTGIVVTCQDGRSQLKNKEKALSVLRSRLYALEQERRARELGQSRLAQVGSGERAEKIRTYNFPQDRITDHRLSQSFSNLPGVLEGELDRIIDALIVFDNAERMRAAGIG